MKAQDERDAKLPKDGKTRIADVLDMNHEVYLNGLVSAMFMNCGYDPETDKETNEVAH